MRRLLFVGCLAACQAGPDLSDTTQAATAINSTSMAFGSIQVGSSSGTLTGYIYESTTGQVGTHTDTINSVSLSGSCGEFTINAGTGTVQNQCYRDTGCFEQCPVAPVAPAEGIDNLGSILCDDLQDYSFNASYHPSVAAPVSCVVTFNTSSGTNTVTLSGTGLPPPIHVSAGPGTLNFGGVRINTASTAIGVTVSNTGGQTATINGASVTGGFAITGGNAGGHALGANASEGFTVTCNPGGVGPLNGTFTLSSNDPSTPTIQLGMTCSGIDSALAISPSPAVLPTLRVGETEQKQISITNMGGAATSIQAVTVTGMTMVSAPPAGTMLAAGQGTTATVQF
ncbi:MAG TPA: choice-of-anchor D domain-containing protein, partial [Kofleriaceae bacterium]